MNTSLGQVQAPLDGPASFRRCQLRADTLTAGWARSEFVTWLQLQFVLGDACRSDIVLAVYEALANAAEHAYSASSDIGSMDLHASYDADQDTLRVSVEDRGQWRLPHGVTQSPVVRGRGILLIRALADDTTIDTTSVGTRITMTWRDVHMSRGSLDL